MLLQQWVYRRNDALMQADFPYIPGGVSVSKRRM